jgi:hypothetical protein
MDPIDLFEILCPIIEEYYGDSPELVDMYYNMVEALNYSELEMETCVGISDALDQAIERIKEQ